MWGLFDFFIGETIESWQHRHHKLNMLFNAFRKLNVKSSDFSAKTVDCIVASLTMELPRMNARSVSNVLFYSSKLRWPEFFEPRIAAVVRTQFFLACPEMTMASELSNGLWALVSLTDLKWQSQQSERRPHWSPQLTLYDQC